MIVGGPQPRLLERPLSHSHLTTGPAPFFHHPVATGPWSHTALLEPRQVAFEEHGAPTPLGFSCPSPNGVLSHQASPSPASAPLSAEQQRAVMGTPGPEPDDDCRCQLSVQITTSVNTKPVLLSGKSTQVGLSSEPGTPGNYLR